MNKTAFLITVGVTGAFVVVGFVASGVVRQASDPVGTELRARIPAVDPSRPASSPFSADFHTNKARLVNQLGRRSRWSEEDLAFFERIVGSGWPDVPKPQGGDELEAWLLLDTAFAVVGDHYRVGAELDPDAMAIFRETVYQLLDHPQGYARRRGVTAGANAGMLAEPEFRQAVERMAQRDPDERVRHSARVKLDQDVGIPTDSDECPTCPKGGQP